MILFLIKLFFYTLLIVTSLNLSAETVSLKDIEKFVDAHPALQEAKISYDQSVIDIEIAKQYQNPTIDLTSETQNKNSITFSLPIERPGLRAARISANENAANSMKYAYDTNKNYVAIDLINSYFTVVLKMEEKFIAEYEVLLLNEIFDIVSKEVLKNESPEYDLTKIEAELNESKSTLIGAENDLIKSQQILGEKLGLSHIPNILYDQSEQSKYLSCLVDEKKAENNFTNNPIYLATLYNSKKEEQNYFYELEQQKIQPTLFISKEIDTGVHNQIIGISIPLPIFHNREAQVNKAKMQISYSKSITEKVVRNFNLDYEQNSTNYTNSKNTIERYKKHILKSSEHAYNVAKKAYEKDEINFVDLIDSYRLYIASKYAFTKNKFDAIQSCVNLSKYD